MDAAQLAKAYLQETILMQLATVSDGQPWVCTVHFAAGDDWHLYWLSRPTRRHSQELAANPQVAGAIVKAHAVGEAVQGLQFAGVAQEAKGENLARGKAAYQKRFGIESADDHLMYVVHPSRLKLFDTVHFPEDPEQEIEV